jgi:hypothetical protein
MLTMTRRLPTLLALALAAALPGAAAGEELVREFRGERSTETAEFEVRAPWLIDWRVNSDYAESMGFDVELLSAPTDVHAGRVVKTKRRGNGLRLVNESGRFRFKIESALAYWTIKVIQLTPEEAEAYSPKGAGSP